MNMTLVVATIFTSIVAVLLLTPVVRARARRLGIVDHPDLHRKLHARSTPLCGGVAVYLATVFSAGVFLFFRQYLTPTATVGPYIWPLLAASLVIIIVGVADDALNLRARQKLAGQLLAVAILVVGGLQIDTIEFLELTTIDLGLLAIPFTVLWMLTAINSLNLLDGADGFASSIGLVISSTIAVIAVYLGHWDLAIIAGALAGGLAGFLVFNFPPSSIFLGDAGSMLIGLVVGALAIYGNTKEATSVTLLTPLALMAVPFFDTLAALIRRTLTGRGIAIGDRAHLHHAMMRRGLGPRRLVAAAILLSLITSAGALATVVTGSEWYAVGSVALLLGILLGGRIFGFNELRLISNRARSFATSLVPAANDGQCDGVIQQRLGLRDSSHGEKLWSALTDFADQHHLSRVRLDLHGSWMDDGHEVLWEQIRPDATIENWKTELPIQIDGRTFGKLRVAGTVTDNSGQHILGPLGELIESLTPSMDRMIEEASSQAAMMQAGIARRVLFINRSYWPDCEATGQLLTELCEDLTDTFDVSVLAGQPNHVAGTESFRTSGVQRRNSVDVYRVKHFQFSKDSMFGKACNFISFFVSATWQSFFIPKHQVVVVETDPFLLAILGGLLKAWRGSRLIIYMQDVYPDVAVGIGKVKDGLVTRTVRRLMAKAYNRADRIVVLSNDMRCRMIDNGVSGDKIICIPNWADTENIYPIKYDNDFRMTHGVNDKFVVMHSGNIGLTQQLDQLLQVAARLKHRTDIQFLLVGDGASRTRLEQVVSEQMLTNVRFIDYQAREHLALSLSAADIHIVSMHPAITGCLVPSKMYGIMASGTPVVAVVPEATDLFEIVKSEQVGFAIRPGDEDGLCDTILNCADGHADLDEMGMRARKLAESRFDRHHSVKAFADLLSVFIETKTTAPIRSQEPADAPEPAVETVS